MGRNGLFHSMEVAADDQVTQLGTTSKILTGVRSTCDSTRLKLSATRQNSTYCKFIRFKDNKKVCKLHEKFTKASQQQKYKQQHKLKDKHDLRFIGYTYGRRYHTFYFWRILKIILDGFLKQLIFAI